MEKYLPAICYHPTTVCLIDDNLNFLRSLQRNLDDSHAVLQSFANPQEALAFVTTSPTNSFAKRVIQRQEEAELEHRTLDIDVSAIHKTYHNPKRFEEIAVIIVDYTMPEMTGLELCAQLKNYPFKKIMLTGEADDILAIKSFNAGLIDRFIRKDTPDFITRLNTSILELQKQYFQSLAAIIVDSLIHDPNSFLTDPTFIDFFENLVTQYQAVEYYLMDSSGSFLLFDRKAKPMWLAVKTQQEMADLAAYAAFEKVAPSILKPLLQGTHVPYFHTAAELQTPPAKWGPYLHPAQKLVGTNTYYYALITDPHAYKLKKP